MEGFPDLSAGQEGETIGILSGWRLQLIGAPELEGTRDHLEALMNAVMPYARHQLSGVRRRFGGDDSFVAIEPNGDRHQLELRSSRAGVEPLQLNIDDAELSDLVRCLDRLRLTNAFPCPGRFRRIVCRRAAIWWSASLRSNGSDPPQWEPPFWRS